MNIKTFNTICYSSLGFGVIYLGSFLCKVHKDEIQVHQNKVEKLKSYNLPADEFQKLSKRVENTEGYIILDSLAQDKKEKQIFEQGKQFVRDSIKSTQETFAVKNFSAKVDTALKALKK